MTCRVPSQIRAASITDALMSQGARSRDDLGPTSVTGQEASGLSSTEAAHDLSNFLQVTQSALRLIERGLDAATRDRLKPVLAAAAGSLDRAVQMGRDVFRDGFHNRDFMAISAGAMLVRMADELMLTCGPQIALELALDNAAPQFLCSPVQFDSAILNLVINARQAMPNGGRIKISVARGATSLSGGPTTTVSVADTGCGMAEDVARRIFEPFVTMRADQGGTGLGLAAVQRTVSSAGGSIEVHTRLRVGTIFSLTFPGVLPPA